MRPESPNFDLLDSHGVGLTLNGLFSFVHLFEFTSVFLFDFSFYS